MDLSRIPARRLRRWFKTFNKFMVLLWRLGLGSYGNGTRYGGFVMVLKHTGRKTGLARLTPLNFAEVGGDLYCTAGFGQTADWYRNITVNPRVEVWLPDGRRSGLAEDVTGRPDRTDLLRRVIIASGFAGPLFGVNEKKITDEEVEGLLGTYRLVRIRREQAVTGRGGPGDLAWVWPLAVLVLLLLLARRRHRNKGKAEGRGRNRETGPSPSRKEGDLSLANERRESPEPNARKRSCSESLLHSSPGSWAHISPESCPFKDTQRSRP